MPKQQYFEAILIGKSILLREGLATILHSPRFRIVASVPWADDLLLSHLQLERPLFLIAHTGDDFETAVEQIEVIRNRDPNGRIAMVTDRYRRVELVSALRAGANGYFVDVMTCDVFVKSIELVMMGETIYPPAFLSFVLDTDTSTLDESTPRDERERATPAATDEALAATEDTITPRLSPREKSILRLLVEGDSNKCIARKIDIAEATVKVHVKAILRKIRVQNRTQAAVWGMKNGWPAPPANNTLKLLAVDASGPPTNPKIPEIKQYEVQAPRSMAKHVRHHVDALRFDHTSQRKQMARHGSANS